MKLNMKLLGAKELLKRAGDAEKFLGEPLRQAFRGALEALEGEVKLETPRDIGDLFRSISHEIDSAPIPVWGKVGTDKAYGPPVEYGSKPHKVSPRKLEGWARRHHVNAFAVAGAIARRGTKPHWMFYKGWKSAEGDIEDYFEAAGREIEEKFAS